MELIHPFYFFEMNSDAVRVNHVNLDRTGVKNPDVRMLADAAVDAAMNVETSPGKFVHHLERGAMDANGMCYEVADLNSIKDAADNIPEGTNGDDQNPKVAYFSGVSHSDDQHLSAPGNGCIALAYRGQPEGRAEDHHTYPLQHTCIYMCTHACTH